MEENNDTYEYELIDISFVLRYEQEEEVFMTVNEDSHISDVPMVHDIAYDTDGIPIGNSKEEIKMRQRIIFGFYERWKCSNPEKAVRNRNLNADILIRNESVVEAAAHASKRYKSTLAVLRLDEVLANASEVAVDMPKPGNKNQQKLVRMIIMSYECPDIGVIKLTVGVRRRSKDNIQYGITALEEGEQIVPANKTRKKNKAPHKK